MGRSHRTGDTCITGRNDPNPEVQLPNREGEKVFIPATTTCSVRKEENMRVRYSILLISVVIALFLVIVPTVSAYSISVSGVPTTQVVNVDRQSLFNSLQNTQTRSDSAIFPFFGETSAYDGSYGTVRAYSENHIRNLNEEIRFSESVSAHGIINTFIYNAHFES